VVTVYWWLVPMTASHLFSIVLGSVGFFALAALKPSIVRAGKKLDLAGDEEEEGDSEEENSEEEEGDSEEEDGDSEEEGSSEEESHEEDEDSLLEEEAESEGKQEDEGPSDAGLQRAAAPIHARVLSRAARLATTFAAGRPPPPQEDPPKPPSWLVAEAQPHPALLGSMPMPRMPTAVDLPEVRELEEQVHQAREFQRRLEEGQRLDSEQMGKVMRCGELEHRLARRHAEQVIARIGGVLLVDDSDAKVEPTIISRRGGRDGARGRSAKAQPKPPAPTPRSQPLPAIDESSLRELAERDDCCWAWAQTGRCPRGPDCAWRHPPLVAAAAGQPA